MRKTTKEPRLEFAPNEVAPGGVQAQLDILAHFENDPRSEIERSQDSRSRPFKVYGRLGKVALLESDINGKFSSEDGDSFLVAPAEAIGLVIDVPQGYFEIKSNASRRYAVVEYSCNATSTDDAKIRFIRAVCPILDLFCFGSDAPLFITTMRIEDLDNQRISILFTAPYGNALVKLGEHAIHPELLPVYALYREAKNASSNFYKFLCYHKLLEGLFGELRKDLRAKARARSIDLTKVRDLMPDSPHIDFSLRGHIGRPTKEFYDQVLTPRFRNAVTHFITKDGGVLNMSAPEHIAAYDRVVFAAEACARAAIESFAALVDEYHREIAKRAL